MIIAIFSIEDKDKRFRFFKKTFLLANFSIDITLGMLFFILFNVKVNYANLDLS